MGDQDGRMRVWPWRAGQDDGDRTVLPLVHGGHLGETELGEEITATVLVLGAESQPRAS